MAAKPLVRLAILSLALSLGGPALAEPPTEPPPAVTSAPKPQEDVGAEVSAEILQRAALAYHRNAKFQAPAHLTSLSPHKPGALAGKRIAMSPGHGIQTSGGVWDFQRVITQGLREDIHTSQWAIEFLLPMIERAGGEIVPIRERSFADVSVVVDNDGPAAPYAETGAWSVGGAAGFGGTYRYAYGSDTETATATWTFSVSKSGDYPIYLYFLSGTNRSQAAKITVSHVGGTTVGTLPQDDTLVETFPASVYPNIPPASDTPGEPSDFWRHLGVFPFEAGVVYQVTLSNEGTPTDRVLIADAIRVGGGMGELESSAGTPSGLPRWQESAETFLTWLGAPDWLLVNDVSARPLYALYRHADVYLALHTNCCTSSGTSTWVWYPEMWVAQSAWPANFAQTDLPPGTMELANSLQNEVVARVRANWDPAWTDQGVIGANFGELRAIRNAWYEDVNTHNISPPVSIPAALMEVAYHDTAYDASLIRTLEYRQDVARGLLVGLIRALEGPNAPLPPLSPTHVSATTTVQGLHVRWRAVEDPLATQASPTRFNVYLSTDGVLFSPQPVVVEGATEVVLPLADCDALYVKVSAANDGGESLDSAIVGGKRPSLGGARILYVDGVDREIQLEADPVNPRSYARIYGPALTDALAGAGFDTALDEAVEEALLWAHYDLVVWATSETSTRRLSVDPSQRLAIDLLTAGGTPLLISGAELGWHLVERGTVEEQAFFEGVLGARYLNDDAGSTVIDASLAALDSAIVFGDCSADAACIEYPDLLGPAPGGEVVLTYDNGGAAAVRAVGRDVITAGFPLEAVADTQQRHDLIAALAAELLDPALASAGVCVAPPEPELEPELEAELELELEPELEPEELEAEPDVAEALVEEPMDVAEVLVEGAAEAVEVDDLKGDAAAQPKNTEDGCSCAVNATKRPLSAGFLSALTALLLGLCLTRRRR